MIRLSLMRTSIILSLCFTGIVTLAAQDKISGPPEQMWLCTAADSCELLQFNRDKTYVNLGQWGTSPEFRYHLDAWEPGFIALSGTSYKTDFDGRRKMVVISGVREPGANALKAVAHFILGHQDKVQNVTIKWDRTSEGGEADAKLGSTVKPDHL
jgi:hypothetical protein